MVLTADPHSSSLSLLRPADRSRKARMIPGSAGLLPTELASMEPLLLVLDEFPELVVGRGQRGPIGGTDVDANSGLTLTARRPAGPSHQEAARRAGSPPSGQDLNAGKGMVVLALASRDRHDLLSRLVVVEDLRRGASGPCCGRDTHLS